MSVAVVSSVLTLGLSSCGDESATSDDGGASGKVAVKLGLPAGSSQSHFWDVMVATEKGYFDANGLDVEAVDSTDAPTTAQAITSSSVDIGATTPDTFISAIDRGAKIKIVGQGALNPSAIVGTSDMNDLTDLKGKKFAVISLDSGTGLLVMAILKKGGIASPTDSLNFVISGSTPARLSALLSGAIDGTILSPPALFEAVEKGYKILATVSDNLTIPFIFYAANEDFLNAHPDAMKGFLRALQQADDWLDDPANKEEAIKILRKYSTETSEELANKTYDLAITQVGSYSKGVVPQAKGVEEQLELMGLDSDVSKYVDGSYAQ